MIITKHAASGNKKIDRATDELRRRINPSLRQLDQKRQEDKNFIQGYVDENISSTGSLISSLDSRVSTIESRYQDGSSLSFNGDFSVAINQVYPSVLSPIYSKTINAGASGRFTTTFNGVFNSTNISSILPAQYTFYITVNGSIVYSIGFENMLGSATAPDTYFTFAYNRSGYSAGQSLTIGYAAAKDFGSVTNISLKYKTITMDGI